MLMGYKFNRGNAESFGEVIKLLVPDTLSNLFLIDNLLKDNHIANIFQSLAESDSGGLSSFKLVQNQIGYLTIKSLSTSFFASDAAKWLQKFQIKEPFVANRNMDMSVMFKSMASNVNNLRALRVMQISQMKLNRECVPPLVEVVKNLSGL